MTEELNETVQRDDVPCEEHPKEPSDAAPERVARPLAVSRRACIAGFCLLGAGAACGVAAATVASLNASAAGQLIGPAGDAAGRIVSESLGVGRDTQQRAASGEGLTRGTVCIDAGHGGGYDLTLTPIGPGSSEMQYVEPGGASGVATGNEEAWVTLSVAMLLRDKLRDRGVEVVMVREDDSRCYSSEERAEVANACGADIFVRLHADSEDSGYAYGFTTLVPGYNDWTAGIVEASAYAASVIHPFVIQATGANDRGIVERYDLAGFNFCKVPVVLFEMGYLSNPQEDLLLADPAYQELLAQGMCEGVLAYLDAVAL